MEDDASAAAMLSAHLEAAGYDVRVAATGEQGLSAARECTPEAVLLDLRLPGMDGWEVLTALKADDQFRHIPVVIISVAGPRAIGMALGAVDYFVKPLVGRPCWPGWRATDSSRRRPTGPSTSWPSTTTRTASRSSTPA
nr:hypothetical protein GCM10020092_021620 [Actinoplanes digitatis]